MRGSLRSQPACAVDSRGSTAGATHHSSRPGSQPLLPHPHPPHLKKGATRPCADRMLPAAYCSMASALPSPGMPIYTGRAARPRRGRLPRRATPSRGGSRWLACAWCDPWCRLLPPPPMALLLLLLLSHSKAAASSQDLLLLLPPGPLSVSSGTTSSAPAPPQRWWRGTSRLPASDTATTRQVAAASGASSSGKAQWTGGCWWPSLGSSSGGGQAGQQEDGSSRRLAGNERVPEWAWILICSMTCCAQQRQARALLSHHSPAIAVPAVTCCTASCAASPGFGKLLLLAAETLNSSWQGPKRSDMSSWGRRQDRVAVVCCFTPLVVMGPDSCPAAALMSGGRVARGAGGGRVSSKKV
jgi:hypothetical protein